ncbi:MAG: bifunctional diguanylate cyclase/phosphodiesterase [Pseudomonadota bacterium]
MDSDPSARQARGASRRGVPAWLASLAAFALGLVLTFALAAWQLHRDDLDQARQFDALARSKVQVLHRQLGEYDLALRALQAAFLTAPVDAGAFSQAYRVLALRQRLPGLQAVVFARRAKDGDGERYPTELVEPREGNERVFGLDVRRQPANLAALQRSRDTDQPALSAPFRLIQDAPDGPADGLLLRLPVYTPGPPPADVATRRARFAGSLAMSFRISRMADAMFDHGARARLHVRIADVTGREPLAIHAPGCDESGRASRWRHSQLVSFGGRLWRVDMHDGGHGRRDKAGLVPLMATGGTASLLLAMWVGSLARSRRRALELGEAMSLRFNESEERFRAVNELLPALVVLALEDSDEITYANEAARVRLGAEVEHARLSDLFEDPALRAELADPASSGWEGVEAMLRSTNGDRFWASVSMARVRIGGQGKRLMVASDISQQRQLTELLSYQASHDALTELYNRREFERRVERQIAQMGAGGPACALLFVDLDQFKLINDTSGHVAGDQLLSQLATVMREQLRGGDVLARLGGDEFGVLACDVHDEAGARLVAERLRQHIDSYTFVWEQASYGITASIGGVLLDADTGLKELFAQADTACYMAKEAGRNRVHFYTGSNDAAARRRTEMEWAHRIRWALEEDRLRLFYQEVRPLHELSGGAQLEVLLRLADEQNRIVSPGAFIPAAERYGLMPAIDRWVIQTTLANFDRLHPEGRGLRQAAINLSGASLEDETLADVILSLLQRHGVDPQRLCLEITETVAVRNLAQVSRVVNQLRRVGCCVALDDFGAGMSSFGYLKNLPVDVIKIDGSFVQDLLSDPMSYAIVRAVTDIGHQRGMKVTAEWVDSEEVIRALAELGVDHAQGYALHRPELAMMYRGVPADAPQA